MDFCWQVAAFLIDFTTFSTASGSTEQFFKSLILRILQICNFCDFIRYLGFWL